MSGGSYDYACFRVKDVAGEIRSRHRQPLFVAFADHLERVADVMQSIEWADSGDTLQEDAERDIRAFLSPQAELDAAVAEARIALAALTDALTRATEAKP